MPSPPLPRLRAELVAASRRLHQMGWVANHDGNLSVRLTGDRLLITPTAVSKRDVDDTMLIIVDMQGRVLEGRRKPFSELELHLAAYRARPEVECVAHAHPPHASAFGLVGVELGPLAMPEIVVSLGESIPTVPLLMPKSPELVKAVEATAGTADAMLLARNGALTLGSSLEQAILRMELVEHYAKILSIARGLGTVQALPPSFVNTLLETRIKAGLGPKPKR
jgi:L-fuculose-phosphate aldolase